MFISLSVTFARPPNTVNIFDQSGSFESISLARGDPVCSICLFKNALNSNVSMSFISRDSGADLEIYCSKFFCVFYNITFPPVIPAPKLKPILPRMIRYHQSCILLHVRYSPQLLLFPRYFSHQISDQLFQIYIVVHLLLHIKVHFQPHDMLLDFLYLEG